MRAYFSITSLTLAAGLAVGAQGALAQDIKIALIAGKTGPLEAYAKQTETGMKLGLEFATKGASSPRAGSMSMSTQ